MDYIRWAPGAKERLLGGKTQDTWKTGCFVDMRMCLALVARWWLAAGCPSLIEIMWNLTGPLLGTAVPVPLWASLATHSGFLPRSLVCEKLALALLSSPREKTVIPETGPLRPAAETGQRAGGEVTA